MEAAVEENGFVKLKSTENTVRTLGSSDELGKNKVFSYCKITPVLNAR